MEIWHAGNIVSNVFSGLLAAAYLNHHGRHCQSSFVAMVCSARRYACFQSSFGTNTDML